MVNNSQINSQNSQYLNKTKPFNESLFCHAIGKVKSISQSHAPYLSIEILMKDSSTSDDPVSIFVPYPQDIMEYDINEGDEVLLAQHRVAPEDSQDYPYSDNFLIDNCSIIKKLTPISKDIKIKTSNTFKIVDDNDNVLFSIEKNGDIVLTAGANFTVKNTNGQTLLALSQDGTLEAMTEVKAANITLTGHTHLASDGIPPLMDSLGGPVTGSVGKPKVGVR